MAADLRLTGDGFLYGTCTAVAQALRYRRPDPPWWLRRQRFLNGRPMPAAHVGDLRTFGERGLL